MISKKGFDFIFDPKACETCKGKCCSGESGRIFINREEIFQIQKYLNINQIDFMQNYIIKSNNRLSLKEKFIDGNFQCIFFDNVKNRCKIYSVRPSQCRTFPFWNYFKKNLDELLKECKGVKINKMRENE